MRAWRWLLRLYPASFRGEYRRELEADVRAQRVLLHGAGSVALFWTDTMLDTIGNAILAHLELLRQDLHYAGRALRRTPTFAIAAIAVITIGIGANTAAFSVADFALLRPLPFVQPDRLVTLWERPPDFSMLQPSAANYQDWRRTATTFDGMGAYHELDVTLTGSGVPLQLAGVAITGQLFQLLGARPVIGHLFAPADEAGGARVVLISDALWRDSFGGDPGVIGRTVELDGAPWVVAGVMPRSFAFPDRSARLWTPMRLDEQTDTDRNNNWFYVVARLKPGVAITAAQAEMSRVASGIAQRFPKEDGTTGANVMALRDSFNAMSAPQTKALLYALCGAAACVLLIACANLANLLLVRALGRRRELAVRTAIGAGRERLVRQLVTESLLLVLGGVVGGVALAAVMVPLLTHLVPDVLPFAQAPTVNGWVLGLAVFVSIVTGVGFGVIPAVRGNGSLDALRDNSRGGGGRRARLRSALVIGEVTLSIVLLVSAGLLLRAMWRVEAIDPGFRKENILTLRTALPAYKYQRTAPRLAYYDRVLTAVRAIPGVRSAGFTSFLPMTNGGGLWPVGIAGAATERTGTNTASLRFVTPGYLETMGIAVTQGRDVSDADTPTSAYGAIVSESFAKRFWPNRNPLGEHFDFGLHDRTVIGVVRDVKVRGPERQSEPQVYLPYQQVPDSELIWYAPKDLAIRSALPPAALAPVVRHIIGAADADQPIADVQSMADIVGAKTASRSTQLHVLAAFALVALLLAAVGIHGVLAFTVSQRRREMGIRLALGAQRRQLVGMVLSQGATLAVAGIIPGAVIGYGAARAMASILAGIEPADFATFTVAIVLAAAMVLAGSWFPAVSASRVDPNTILQGE